ncbi:hypothetical protein AAFF_G00331140, partial [Aldrovandia affinis]
KYTFTEEEKKCVSIRVCGCFARGRAERSAPQRGFTSPVTCRGQLIASHPPDRGVFTFACSSRSA